MCGIGRDNMTTDNRSITNTYDRLSTVKRGKLSVWEI